LDIGFFPSQFFALSAALKYESDQKQLWIMCTVKSAESGEMDRQSFDTKISSPT
jgi:hypothetical protein